MAIAENDFVELEFTGKVSITKEVFDTNIERDAKAAGLKTKGLKPAIIAVGHGMLPEGLNNNLVGKKVGQTYSVKLKPHQAFGARKRELVKMVPTKHFHAQEINPVRGMQLSLDGQLVKVLSSDRGRTLIDFNNSLAGKEIQYIYTIKRKVDGIEEQVDAVQDFLFRRTFPFEIKKDMITFTIPKEVEQFVKFFSNKFQEIFNLKLETNIKDIRTP
jgi:FKBP-type peptidyl-prolyl cis-trans isomerase 2